MLPQIFKAQSVSEYRSTQSEAISSEAKFVHIFPLAAEYLISHVPCSSETWFQGVDWPSQPWRIPSPQIDGQKQRNIKSKTLWLWEWESLPEGKDHWKGLRPLPVVRWLRGETEEWACYATGWWKMIWHVELWSLDEAQTVILWLISRYWMTLASISYYYCILFHGCFGYMIAHDNIGIYRHDVFSSWPGVDFFIQLCPFATDVFEPTQPESYWSPAESFVVEVGRSFFDMMHACTLWCYPGKGDGTVMLYEFGTFWSNGEITLMERSLTQCICLASWESNCSELGCFELSSLLWVLLGTSSDDDTGWNFCCILWGLREFGEAIQEPRPDSSTQTGLDCVLYQHGAALRFCVRLDVQKPLKCVKLRQHWLWLAEKYQKKSTTCTTVSRTGFGLRILLREIDIYVIVWRNPAIFSQNYVFPWFPFFPCTAFL